MRDSARASTLIGYRELVSELGGNSEELLKRFHIEPILLDRAENMIPYRSVIRLLEATAQVLGCEDFGLKLAQQQGLDVVGPLAIIGQNSPTVHQALISMFEHLDFYSPAMLLKIDVKTNPGLPLITFDLCIPDEPHMRQTVEWALSLINRDIKTLTKGRQAAKQILFRHSSPLSGSDYLKYFGTRPFFEQEINAVVVSQATLDYRLDNANSYLRDVVIDYVRKTGLMEPQDLEHQIRILVRQLLPSKDANLKNIAKHLCMHERTLQRKLKENSQNFEEIVDSVRQEKALNLLTDSYMSMAQIAIKLGYAEQTSFNRACRRWYGQSPLQIRKEHKTA